MNAALFTGAALALPAAALYAIPVTPQVCHLQVIPDYTLGFVYRAVLRLSPQCGFTQTLRVRKSSTINTRRGGAPYQPIQPLKGAWTLGRLNNSVPGGALWTSNSWRWEYNDPVLTKGQWRAGEVLYARP
ncbi:hypothetical protein [Deinococcus arenicola]|uniref:Uncharacterized protein n=1 Tax=Deinococcus arenicola TaxID=2994950 RepID=A0ABU4DUB8_9DEIO|nr:hypothetical protein [Deinococcus sp. ZS9-10]MDV6376023.1 hypothetical protein [Deinococcus sp. ZS9-10]